MNEFHEISELGYESAGHKVKIKIFAYNCNPGVILITDIHKYKEICVPGTKTVYESVDHQVTERFSSLSLGWLGDDYFLRG